MKRPFFFLAILMSVFIGTANLFIKDDYYRPEHISHFVSQKPRSFAIYGVVASDPILKHAALGDTYSFLVTPSLIRVWDKWFPACGIISVTSHKDKETEYGEEILFEAAIKAPSDEKESANYTAYLKKKGIFALATIRRKDALTRSTSLRVNPERAPAFGSTWLITPREPSRAESRDKRGIVEGLISVEANDSSSFLRFAYRMKNALNEKINKIFSVPSRYFISALILGERQNISRDWKNIFVNTQTIHLLAISGLHVGIISFIILFLTGLFGLPRDAKYIVTIFLILFYSVMVGWMPSVARSAIMGTVILGACVLKRDADIYNSLGLAACIILIFQPNQLFDMGFILSFGSVLSLIYIYPKINRALCFDKIDRKEKWGAILYYIATLFSASLAVWIGIFPIVLYFFNLISTISIIVNILAIPCMFIVMPLAISAIIFQPFCIFLGAAFKEATEFFLAILLSLLDLCSKMPLAYFNSAPVSVIIIPLYYFVLFVLFFPISIDKGQAL